MKKWDYSNYMSYDNETCHLEAFRGIMFEMDNAKLSLEDLEKHFVKNQRIDISTFLRSLISMKYNGNRNIKEYIMKMFHLASKLKALELELFETYAFNFDLSSNII